MGPCKPCLNGEPFITLVSVGKGPVPPVRLKVCNSGNRRAPGLRACVVIVALPVEPTVGMEYDCTTTGIIGSGFKLDDTVPVHASEHTHKQPHERNRHDYESATNTNAKGITTTFQNATHARNTHTCHKQTIRFSCLVLDLPLLSTFICTVVTAVTGTMPASDVVYTEPNMPPDGCWCTTLVVCDGAGMYIEGWTRVSCVPPIDIIKGSGRD